MRGHNVKKIAFILLSMLLLFHLISCVGGEDQDEHTHEHTSAREDEQTVSCTGTENNTDSHPEDNSPGIDLPIVPN